MGALEGNSGGEPNDIPRLITRLQQEREYQRHERVRVEATLGAQLAAYDALLASAFPRSPRAFDPND